MDKKHFLSACELVKSNLVNFDITRTSNSIGSNIFFDFGEGRKVLVNNKKEFLEHDWSIWLSNTSWRVTKDEKYIVSSGDYQESIQLNIPKLLGKCFQSFRFLSSYLDVEFNFDDGYQITTFFNWAVEDQWIIFLPDETTIRINCETPEQIKEVQKLSENFSIIENYKKLDCPLPNGTIVSITYGKWEQPTFHFENGFSIRCHSCDWRLEKNNEYLIGYGDCYLDDEHQNIKKLDELIGKKIQRIDIANSMLDARFQFDDQYVLKTFTRCQKPTQWSISSESALIYRAKIELMNESPLDVGIYENERKMKMGICITDIEHFLQTCESIKSNLIHFDITQASISTGSDILFKFGEGRKKISNDNKEFLKYEWTIWLGNTSWRITKDGKYVAGAKDPRTVICQTLKKLEGKRFQSFRFLSSYLDIELNFDDGYQITTFVNCAAENQWVIFLSDETNIGIDCETPEQIKGVQKLAEHFTIVENYKKLDCPLPNGTIVSITYGKWEQPTFHFENGFSIHCLNCDWRLEKNNDYLVGHFEVYSGKDQNKIKKLDELIGKKIQQIDIANSMMDARFQFDDQYVLKTFTYSEEITQWSISSASVPIFEAKVELRAPKDEVLKSPKDKNDMISNEYKNDQVDAAMNEIEREFGRKFSKQEKDTFHDHLAHKKR